MVIKYFDALHRGNKQEKEKKKMKKYELDIFDKQRPFLLRLPICDS